VKLLPATRRRIIRGLSVRSTDSLGRNRVDGLKSPDKPFEISKREVWDAYLKVKASQGAPEVDGCPSRTSKPI
jgi:hypothetical protein